LKRIARFKVLQKIVGIAVGLKDGRDLDYALVAGIYAVSEATSLGTIPSSKPLMLHQVFRGGALLAGKVGHFCSRYGLVG